MKILSILPVDYETVAPHVAVQKREDKQILTSLPSRVCNSFGVAQLLLQEYPLAYDVIISTYTPDELLPVRDLVAGASGPYGAATNHITRILTDNPTASMVLWTGAISKEIDLPPELSARISLVLRSSSNFRGQLLCGENADRDFLRYQITRALTGLCLMLNEKGEIMLQSICWRGLVEMVFQDSDHPLPVRLWLRKSILSMDHDMEEFMRLLNQDNVTAQGVESFLDGHPCFPLGNYMPVRRWMVGFGRDGQDRIEPPINILLEPVWVAKFWKIPGLKTPAFPCPRGSVSERQLFCQLMAMALSQMRAKREAFKQPQFLRRLADAGLAGYSPRLALVLGGRDIPAFPRTPPPGVEKNNAMSYQELLGMVRTEMAWLVAPASPPENLRYRDVILRELKVKPEAPRPGQPSVKVTRLLTVLNDSGLDIYAAAVIGKTVMRYYPLDAVRVTMAGCAVSGNEFMSMLALEACQGKQLLVEVEGPRAIALLEELTDLFNKGFYSEEHMLPVPDSHHEYCQGPGISSPVSGGPC